ncbi:NUDIX hydrolase [Carboxylicivirga caseinilyticus]|uniref:NUDIX hydrolase n=1 Tax=Carboxylicivirga caseinilyticus TaxID=3417572 RepID=UPI003D33C61B|nr:CoA pyrophosphatase [Marinilabiliaceae bacterium A049]
MSNQTQILLEAFRKPLPGKKAQSLMAPSVRFTGKVLPEPNKARESSVLILLYVKEGNWYLPLMKRSVYKGAHSGQVSFPGGKTEDGDTCYFNTAIREAEEEIGIVGKDVSYVGELTSLYIPNSNFVVYPQVGVLPYAPEFKPDPREVDVLIEAPLSQLANPQNIKCFSRKINDIVVEAPFFSLNDFEIWGATAMILSEFLQVLKENQLNPLLHSYSDYNAQGYQ